MANNTSNANNANYKKMYLTLLNSTENAINELIEAQRSCEKMYIEQGEQNITVLTNEDQTNLFDGEE